MQNGKKRVVAQMLWASHVINTSWALRELSNLRSEHYAKCALCELDIARTKHYANSAFMRIEANRAISSLWFSRWLLNNPPLCRITTELQDGWSFCLEPRADRWGDTWRYLTAENRTWVLSVTWPPTVPATFCWAVVARLCLVSLWDGLKIKSILLLLLLLQLFMC